MNEYRWLIYAAASALCASAVAILGKLGMQKVDSNLATAVRSIVMTLLLVGFVSVLGVWSKVKDLTWQPMVMIILSGAAGAASWLFYFKALASPGGDVAKVGPIDKLSLPIAIVLAMIVLKERPSALNWAGIGLVAVGAYLASVRSAA